MRMPLSYSHKLQHTDNYSLLYNLPDDLVIFILSKFCSTVSSPSDFFNVLLTSKRLNRIGQHPLVLSKLGAKAFAVKPRNWSESAHSFLRICANVDNIDACYTLGMIRFYCLQKRKSGLSLIIKAATKSHAPALYSLAVIKFNGSGGVSRDLQAGVALCARASLLGHIDALRELGHCIHDGYGARQNVAEGHKLLARAKMRELAFVIRAVAQPSSLLTWRNHRFRNCERREELVSSLAGSYGYVGAVEPVKWFMREWFESGRGVLEEGFRLCSHIGCGRPEMRAHEFRLCSVCEKVNYCSRGCQALDWKLRHNMECAPVELWVDGADDGDGLGIAEMGN